MRDLLFGIILVITAAIAAFIGFNKGVQVVKKGLVDNYPVIMGIAKSSVIERDSFLQISITPESDSALFTTFSPQRTSDTLKIHIPYYALYGIDPSRLIRTIETEECIEVWLPRVIIRYSEFRFDNMSLNEKPYLPNASQQRYLRFALVSYLDKIKRERKDLKDHVSKQFMYYFIPYKYELKMLFENEEHPLPAVPGINKNVDEAIEELVGKN